MARVNVEEEFFASARVRRLGMILGSEHEAVGVLVYLWRDSQEELRVEGTREEIAAWCRARDLESGNRLVDALVAARFISQIEGTNRFTIHGNEPQIEGRVSRMKRAQKGADATRRRWAEQKDAISRLKAGSKPAPSARSAVQCSSGQGNAVQEEGAPAARETAPTPSWLIELWQKARGTLPAVLSTQLSPLRAEAVAGALRRNSDAAHWLRVIAAMNDSDYLTGRSGKRNPAGFDFMVEHDAEIMEGKYANPPPAVAGPTALAKLQACGLCNNGVIRARNVSNGTFEWCSCACPAGRARSGYVRFEETKFERVAS